MVPELTPSQTVGPFFAPLIQEGGNVLVTPETRGERIRIEGHVYDGDGAPIPDAMVEIWQADADGHYRHPADRWSGSSVSGAPSNSGAPTPADPAFHGFGRAGTDDNGFYWFETIKPGRVPSGGGGFQAPHINMIVMARGLLDQVATRLYFDDEQDNATDPVLRALSDDRRRTLIAARNRRDGRTVYRFDVVLQGENETVFFDC